MPKNEKINLLESPNAVVLLLNAVLQKISLYTQHLDIQSNMTIVLSAAVLVFSASRLSQQTPSNFSWSLLVLAIFSGLSALLALFAINPPHFMRKKGQKESLFYHSKIARYASSESYFQDFRKMMEDEEEYVRELTKEIHNMSRFSYLPKRLLSDLSRTVLVIGFFLSFLIFSLHTFIRLF